MLLIFHLFAPNGFLGAIVSEKPGEEFFYNKEYLSKYNNTSKSKRHVIPGHAYFNRVESFFESHYERGELYFEFLKGDCSRKGELCETCKENGWIGPDSLKRTPRPYPDVTQLPSYHYLSVGNIPVHNRAPDDFQPRAQLRKLFVEGNIKCGDNDKIEAFSKKYIVSPDLVKEYLEHLTNIEVRKNMRQDEKRQAKKDEETKGYGDYNWEELYKSGNLKKLKVAELNKYIFRHNLSRRKMSKSEKLNLLSAHISKGLCERILTLSAAETALATEDSDTQSEDDDVSVSEDSESEDELLLEFGDASNSDENDSKDSESEEEDELPEGARVNRYGRKVGNWRLRYSS